MAETSPKERVLAALNHSQTDRIAVDFGGHRSSGIAALAYPKLRKALNLPHKPIRVYDIIQQLAIIDEDVLDRFAVDTIEVGRGFALKESDWADWVLPDGTPCQVPAWSIPEREKARWVLKSKSGRVIAQMPDGALYFEQCYWPFFEKQEELSRLEEAFDECMWMAMSTPPGPAAADHQQLREGARRLRACTQANTDRAIIGLFGGSLLETGEFLFRNDKFLMMLAAEPARVHAFLDALTELHLNKLETYLQSVGDYIDIILFGDDLGMQNGPRISPRMYREFFKPRQAMMWEMAKKLAGVKVLLHCCGGIRPLLPDLIDAGLDAINPVQISCAGMDAAGLKEDFGSEITFWGGGCDTQHILPEATAGEVAQHVRQQVQILSRDSGFVFQQVHNILADVPPENIIAMFDALNS